MKLNKSILKKIFEKEIVRSVGCTEPVAIGYATAVAFYALENAISVNNDKLFFNKIENVDVKRISLDMNRGVFKNAMAVYIPNTNKKGIYWSSMLGLFCNPSNQMELFNAIDTDVIDKVIKMKKSVNFSFNVDMDKPYLWISVCVENSEGDVGRCVIERNHTDIVHISRNKELIFQRDILTEKNKNTTDILKDISVDEIIDFVIHENITEIEEVNKKIECGISDTRRIVNAGLKHDYGLKLGKTIKDVYGLSDIGRLIEINVASACDVRMGGGGYAVMSISGSGNQGIVATVPVITVADKRNISVRKLKKALALSYLITCKATAHTAYLSALCGCAMKAGLGATSALSYILDGDKNAIKNAMNNLVANIIGILCDGAKVGCAYKLVTASSEAYRCAKTAKYGLNIPYDNGIINADVNETLKNIGRIYGTMDNVDRIMLEIMMDKNKLNYL